MQKVDFKVIVIKIDEFVCAMLGSTAERFEREADYNVV